MHVWSIQHCKHLQHGISVAQDIPIENEHVVFARESERDGREFCDTSGVISIHVQPRTEAFRPCIDNGPSVAKVKSLHMCFVEVQRIRFGKRTCWNDDLPSHVFEPHAHRASKQS